MATSPIDRMIARRLWNGSTAGPTAGNPRRMVMVGRSDSKVIAYSTERVQGFPEWTIVDQYPVW